MRINNNLMALNTQRQLTVNNNNTAKSVEKLSSGYRINRAGDDAAGLAISEKMRSQIRGLTMAARNSQDAISLVQTAEGALSETHAILQRMRELAVQSSTDTNQNVDRSALSQEFEQLKTELTDISSSTKFNNMNLLDGSFGVQVDTDSTASTVFAVTGVASVDAGGAASTSYTFAVAAGELSVSDGTTSVDLGTATDYDGVGTINVSEFGISIKTNDSFTGASLDTTIIAMEATGSGTIQTGANAGEELSITIDDMSAAGLSVNGADIGTRDNAVTALGTVDTAINTVSTQRAKLGAIQNRLEHKINNLSTSAENLQAAESRIRDVDMAKEMSEYTKNNILVQAATSMLAQANNAPQSVLQLLR